MERDKVFLSGLALTAKVGYDVWHRSGRTQPVILDVSIPAAIKVAGETDDVLQTVHYGHLCKAITERVESMTEWFDVHDFALSVCEASLSPAGSSGKGDGMVETTVTLPKALLLAEGFGLHVERSLQNVHGDVPGLLENEYLFVKSSKLSCIIGVNPHERLEKQFVVMNLKMFGAGTPMFRGYATWFKDITDVS